RSEMRSEVRSIEEKVRSEVRSSEPLSSDAKQPVDNTLQKENAFEPPSKVMKVSEGVEGVEGVLMSPTQRRQVNSPSLSSSTNTEKATPDQQNVLAQRDVAPARAALLERIENLKGRARVLGQDWSHEIAKLEAELKTLEEGK